MKLVPLLVATVAVSAPVYAEQAQPSPSEVVKSSSEDAPATLPVSVERIRQALARTPDTPLLQWVNERPDFSTGVEERVTLESYFEGVDYSKAPVPAGGIYAFEQQRLLNPPNHRPAAQPWAAFTSSELAQVAATSALSSLLAGYITRSFQDALRSHGQEVARLEVERAISSYCANQPGRGQHIVICATRD